GSSSGSRDKLTISPRSSVPPYQLEASLISPHGSRGMPALAHWNVVMSLSSSSENSMRVERSTSSALTTSRRPFSISWPTSSGARLTKRAERSASRRSKATPSSVAVSRVPLPARVSTVPQDVSHIPPGNDEWTLVLFPYDGSELVRNCYGPPTHQAGS